MFKSFNFYSRSVGLFNRAKVNPTLLISTGAEVQSRPHRYVYTRDQLFKLRRVYPINQTWTLDHHTRDRHPVSLLKSFGLLYYRGTRGGCNKQRRIPVIHQSPSLPLPSQFTVLRSPRALIPIPLISTNNNHTSCPKDCMTLDPFANINKTR